MNFDNHVFLLISVVILYLIVFYFWKVFRRAGLVKWDCLEWLWVITGIFFFILYVGGLLPSLILLWKSPERLFDWGSWEKVTAYGTVSLSVGTALLATSAYLAFIVAQRHLDRVIASSKATFLLDLEKQSTSPSMLEAQAVLAINQNEIDKKVTASHPHACLL